MEAYTFNPSTQGRGRWITEFEASLSAEPVQDTKATQRNPVLKHHTHEKGGWMDRQTHLQGALAAL